MLMQPILYDLRLPPKMRCGVRGAVREVLAVVEELASLDNYLAFKGWLGAQYDCSIGINAYFAFHFLIAQFSL